MSRRYRLSLLMGCPAGGVSCTGTCSPRRCGTLWGACLLCRPPALPPRCLVGWRGCFCRLPTPPLVYFPAPLPRRGRISPLPPLPLRGRGRFFCFLMQGASPLASPALDRLRHLQSLPLWCPQGGLPSLSPVAPCLYLLFCPLSPQPPSPAGKGEIF